eukprot:scaffold8633_cov154-Isochrysis_galbana.AAC.2
MRAVCYFVRWAGHQLSAELLTSLRLQRPLAAWMDALVLTHGGLRLLGCRCTAGSGRLRPSARSRQAWPVSYTHVYVYSIHVRRAWDVYMYTCHAHIHVYNVCCMCVYAVVGRIGRPSGSSISMM